jgi:hypothetical protein
MLQLTQSAGEGAAMGISLKKRIERRDEKTLNRQRSMMSTLEESLTVFERIRDAVIRTKTELDQIHISSLPFPSGIQAICFDCGDKNLDVVYTSTRDRCQLCAPCFNRRETRGAARTESRAPRLSTVSSHQPEHVV